MTAIQELLERVERLTGSDREVDVLLVATFISKREADIHARHGLSGYDFTASVDAALALCERVLPGCSWHMAKGRLSPKEPMYAVELLRENSPEDVLGAAEAETLPLAILLALLHSQSQG